MDTKRPKRRTDKDYPYTIQITESEALYSTLGGILLAIPAGIAGRKLGRKRTIVVGLILVITSHVLMYSLPYWGVSNVSVPLAIIYFLYAGAFIMVNIRNAGMRFFSPVRQSLS